MKLLLSLIISITVFTTAFSQVDLAIPLNVQKAFDKGSRSHDGQPGKSYWQNTAVYDVAVEFEPPSGVLKGTVQIEYTNNSPDTLKEILFKLYPNIYKKGAVRLMHISPEDITDGVSIESMFFNGEQVPEKKIRITATEMAVRMRPLLPGEKCSFRITYNYMLNKTSHIRTGMVDEGAFFIAYFFPRIAVYDDIDGWNRNPYLGTQEFYNDFCDFTLRITVPSDFIVWATGDLMNGSSIFTGKYLSRIRQAEQFDAILSIIDSTDLVTDGITLPAKKHTWVYEAKNVTDAVFALSNHYIWQSSSLIVDSITGRRTRVDAVFNPTHHDYQHVASDARKTVEAMSFRFPRWPFPYSHMTVFDGLDQMEYPMMANDNPVDDRAESIELTDHEIFHTMFPFYMGTNETKYGWMDEGWATLGEWLISPMIDSTIIDEYGVAGYERAAGTEADLPIATLTTQQTGTSMFINSYPKPAMGYLYVKDMLGDGLFYKGLHHYIRTWNGKHPIPSDFFNCMNQGSGRNLNWFWQRWFFDGGVPDLGIAAVKERGKRKRISIRSLGTKPVPVDLTVEYDNGTTELFHRSIEVWEKAETQIVTFSFRSAHKIKKITLGSTYAPDVNKKDNVFIAR